MAPGTTQVGVEINQLSGQELRTVAMSHAILNSRPETAEMSLGAGELPTVARSTVCSTVRILLEPCVGESAVCLSDIGRCLELQGAPAVSYIKTATAVYVAYAVTTVTFISWRQRTEVYFCVRTSFL
jgi:hypothetical protein